MGPRRASKTTTISLPKRLYWQAERLARAGGMTRSELFREALRRYQREEEDWRALLAYGRARARRAGIRTTAQVERLVDAARR
jgi:metal-responsive CopG/Arc/MetJ family transcriptional regulator